MPKGESALAQRIRKQNNFDTNVVPFLPRSVKLNPDLLKKAKSDLHTPKQKLINKYPDVQGINMGMPTTEIVIEVYQQRYGIPFHPDLRYSAFSFDQDGALFGDYTEGKVPNPGGDGVDPDSDIDMDFLKLHISFT